MVAKRRVEHPVVQGERTASGSPRLPGLCDVTLTVAEAEEFRRWMDDPATPVARPSQAVPTGDPSFLIGGAR